MSTLFTPFLNLPGVDGEKKERLSSLMPGVENHAVPGETCNSSYTLSLFFPIHFEINIVMVGIRVANGAQSIPPEPLCLLTLWCGLDQKRSSDHKDARTGLNSC